MKRSAFLKTFLGIIVAPTVVVAEASAKLNTSCIFYEFGNPIPIENGQHLIQWHIVTPSYDI